jgi:nitrite reductase/ring-hydroxylating ferredoxin subunit
MSRMMRQYWIPAGKSTELKAGGAPVRLLLLGEKLLAFREPNGKVGVIDHVCPHRGASLFYGRNEEGGMRCAYHGWKFDGQGKCVDMPNVPAGRPRPKITTPAYRAAEGNGIFWVYMGEREVPPPLPIFAHHDLDAVFILRECNWLQALEGDIDTSHVGFLHMGAMQLEDLPKGHPSRIRLLERAPEFEVVPTAWGHMSGAYRDCGASGRFWGLAHFLFPFWTITANDMPLGPPWLARAWVPVDDTHTMLITMLDKNWALPPGLSDKNGNVVPGTSFSWGTPVPNSTDWLGRWRIVENVANDHLMSREIQQISAFVGVEGITPQDQAITESQGPIQDRSREHLVPSDEMIVRTRRLLQTTAEKLVENGVVPPGVDNPWVYYGARGGVMPTDSKEDFVANFTRAAQKTATFKQAYDEPVAPDQTVLQDA